MTMERQPEELARRLCKAIVDDGKVDGWLKATRAAALAGVISPEHLTTGLQFALISDWIELDKENIRLTQRGRSLQ